MNEGIIKKVYETVNRNFKVYARPMDTEPTRIKIARDPNEADLKEISSSKTFRYIIDKKGKHVYAWETKSDGVGILHKEVAEMLRIDYEDTESEEGIFGMGIVKDGKILPGGHGMHQTRKYFSKNENSPMKKYFIGLNI